MPTLYRKYRPQSFADVTGQDTIVQTLQNEIAANKLSHAYLFSGPRGVGKTTLARLFAKAVSCEKRKDGQFEPCNDCQACNQINRGRHIDIIEIDAASQTGVDSVRENIIENAGIMPTVLKYKIFIIDEVHMLSTSAFNALLKTLEEPPAHVIFILATTELHKLPATVISRCERYTFKKITFDKMLARLKNLCKAEKVKVDKEVLERIVYKSDGGLRDAESLLGQILSLNLKEIRVEDAQIVLPLSSSETIIRYLKSIVE
ncbi:MAG: DNA polymerase III subunit gamma/tau, partial [Patescibacteria group bacterium]